MFRFSFVGGMFYIPAFSKFPKGKLDPGAQGFPISRKAWMCGCEDMVVG